MPLKVRNSLFFLPLMLPLSITLALALPIAMYLLPSDNWGGTQVVVGIFCFIAFVDCVFRFRWCTYRDQKIFYFSLRKHCSAQAPDSFMTIERNWKTKAIRWIIRIMHWFPGRRGWRGLNLEMWEMFVHTPDAVFSLGMIGGRDMKKNLALYAETLHLPLKNIQQEAVDNDMWMEADFHRYQNRQMAIVAVLGIIILALLLLNR